MLTDRERELILICARQELPEALQERAAKLLREPLEWDALVAEAWRHGVLPLVFRHVRALGGAEIPAQAMHQMRQGYVRAAVRNQAHFQAIALLLEQFAAAGVEVILLKGAALAQLVYRDPALRPFADIDLLVREDRLDDAKSALLQANYELSPELLSERFNRKYHANLPFVRIGDRPVHIELHWKLSDAFSGIRFDHDLLFAHARPTAISSRAALVLSAEDELIYLATHLDNHGYLNHALLQRASGTGLLFDELSGNRLIWFTDLHELLSGQSLDSSLIRDRAARAHAGNAVAVTLHWLQRLLGTKVDPELLRELPRTTPRWPERAVGGLVTRLVSQSHSGSRGRDLFRRKLLATRKGFELRLIRLIDLWDYVFPRRGALRSSTYIAHVCAALTDCAAMFWELQFRRLLRFLRQRTT